MRAICVGFAACTAALPPAAMSAQEGQDEPEHVVRRFFEYVARLQADSAFALTTPDFTLGQGPTALDREQLRALIENATPTTVSVQITEFEATTGADGTTIATYRREARIRPAPDEPIQIRTTYETGVLRFVDGRWLIARLESERGYDLLDISGRIEGRVVFDAPVRIHAVRDRMIYATTTDEMGVQYVVRYRIGAPDLG